MDSTSPSSPELDPRNKKKLYIADASQRRALIMQKSQQASSKIKLYFRLLHLEEQIWNG